MDDLNKPRKSGGRPVHDGWSLYHFEKVEGDKGKSVAKCLKCHNLLKNTTILRLLAHRKKCGLLETILASPTSSIQQKHLQSPQIVHHHEQITPTSTTTLTIQSTEATQLQLHNHHLHHQHQQDGSAIMNKIEIEEYVEDQQQNHRQDQDQQHEVLWTQPQNIETFMDESVTVNQSTMDIVDEDIRRHRKSSQSHKKRSENTTIDAALSSFLIGCNLTFDIIDSKHFKNFVAALNADYKIPSSSQLKTKVLSQLKGMDGAGNSERSRNAKRRKYYSSDDVDSDDE